MKIAPRNRTIQLPRDEQSAYKKKLLTLTNHCTRKQILDRTILQDVHAAVPFLPSQFVDLLFLDPPYNLTKQFRSTTFAAKSNSEYAQWMDSWLAPMIRLLKPTASVYICGDWRSSSAIQSVAEKYFIVRNRITWEREKGRGAKANWKNASEDIWFCTMSEKFTFNLDAVKLKRKVIAPYKINGKPKDWDASAGGNFRSTHPSNLWTDLTVPFWSMPENTEHPTQKPEKLLAKIILASSNKGDVVFDPFLGSGTTSVVAKKLQRKYVGIEFDETFASLAEKRIALAEKEKTIQGFRDGVFWERNSL
ncbi:MAG: site-specific DNA-methyltransferase [Ignavibacteriales bacterium]|nr:site-specific DNA-methyltransferase [Ignavibacteriales bacterium]